MSLLFTPQGVRKLKLRVLWTKCLCVPNFICVSPTLWCDDIWRWSSRVVINIKKTKITASSPIISWEIDGETVETVADFIFWGSKITVDGDYSHEIKRVRPWRHEAGLRLKVGRCLSTSIHTESRAPRLH